ncbi:MAG: RAMP superfamily CRISPR-associated protein [Bryobacteraceae bacterium]
MVEPHAICQCTVQFLTPAFLGGAFQKDQWRTPPFKALLRQWWRVVYAASRNFNVDVLAMREEEGKLFGNAWLEKEVNGRQQSAASRSLVRLRLSAWKDGSQKIWPNARAQTVRHPEVPKPVDAHLYLGYGPLTYEGGTALKSKSCIGAGESAKLCLAFPTQHESVLLQTLRLIHLYGAAGGRSRNGWGSISLTDCAWPKAELRLRDWQEALDRDWPHCIGSDKHGALIWATKPFDNWVPLMRTLAEIKIGLRTQFGFPSGERAPTRPYDRHWLAYPVTNHPVPAWGNQARLPNSLRFRVRSSPNDPKQLIGVIFHMPCLPPPAFRPNRVDIVRVWQRVHKFLDQRPDLQRAEE